MGEPDAPPTDQFDVATGNRGGQHVRAQLDPISDHRMGRTMQTLNPVNLYFGCSGPADQLDSLDRHHGSDDPGQGCDDAHLSA